MLTNKRGDASEVLLFIIIIFFLAVSLTISGFAVTKMLGVVRNTPLNQSDAAATIINAMDNLSTNGINKAMTILFVGLIISMMLSSLMVRVHPAFLFVYILMLIFAIFVGMMLYNAYYIMAQSNHLGTYAQSLTTVVWIMEHSIWILTISGVLSFIILFAKPSETSAF